MKKLTVLVVIMLVAGLLAGCWVLPESKLDYIEAEPAKVTLYLGLTSDSTKNNTQQLEVTAFYTDGNKADVTAECDYATLTTSIAEVVTVNNEGLITAKSRGNAIVSVSYTQHNFWTGKRTRTDEVDVTVEY